jgi:hypothetical protein
MIHEWHKANILNKSVMELAKTPSTKWIKAKTFMNGVEP